MRSLILLVEDNEQHFTEMTHVKTAQYDVITAPTLVRQGNEWTRQHPMPLCWTSAMPDGSGLDFMRASGKIGQPFATDWLRPRTLRTD